MNCPICNSEMEQYTRPMYYQCPNCGDIHDYRVCAICSKEILHDEAENVYMMKDYRKPRNSTTKAVSTDKFYFFCLECWEKLVDKFIAIELAEHEFRKEIDKLKEEFHI